MPDEKARAAHAAHEDARNERAALERIAALQAHEEHVRENTRLRTVAPLAQEPAHEFRTPIVHRYEAAPTGEYLDAPGADDVGGFDGCVV